MAPFLCQNWNGNLGCEDSVAVLRQRRSWHFPLLEMYTTTFWNSKEIFPVGYLAKNQLFITVLHSWTKLMLPLPKIDPQWFQQIWLFYHDNTLSHIWGSLINLNFCFNFCGYSTTFVVRSFDQKLYFQKQQLCFVGEKWYNEFSCMLWILRCSCRDVELDTEDPGVDRNISFMLLFINS